MKLGDYFEATVRLVTCSILLEQSRSDERDQLQQDYDHVSMSLGRYSGRRPDVELAEHLGLTHSERAVLWLAVALSVDPQARGALATADLNREHAQRFVYRSIASLEAITEMSERGTLRRLRLLERSDAGGSDAPESRQTWAVAQRVVAWLHGDQSVSGDLEPFAHCEEEAQPSLEQLAVEKELVTNACRAAAVEASVVVAAGRRGDGRRSLLAAAARAQGTNVVAIDAGRLSRDPVQLRSQLKRVARECLLTRRMPIICNIDVLVNEGDVSRVDLIGSELVPEIDGPVFVTCGPNRPAMRWGRPTIVIDVKPPTSAQRAQLWLRELGQGTQSDGEYLATQYPLAPALIHHAASAAKARATGQPIQPDDIYQGVRAVLDDKLGDYAKRVEVTQTWDDLVLPAEQQEAIDYLIARIRQRRTVYEQWGFAAKVGKGLGTSALFSGPPGTGKTMVAALIAKELGLELYQVDMAKLVSKFIGETERNLAALFDAAEAGQAILLFDEADSLFGKRTDVKSSNDRYANLETNYLLQRLESFTGICLLTSNHESNIDPAFQRRLSLHLRFELPDVDERAALWRAMLPGAAPVAPNLDMQGLARRFVMSGGYIRNAALRAAFLAADEGAVITASHLERAARLEYEGMGKIA